MLDMPGDSSEVNPESWANNFDLMRWWWNRGFKSKKVCFENRILKKWWLLHTAAITVCNITKESERPNF